MLSVDFHGNEGLEQSRRWIQSAIDNRMVPRVPAPGHIETRPRRLKSSSC
jgi:hypothetical protein